MFVEVDNNWGGPAAVVAPAVVEQMGPAPETVALAVTGAVSEQQEEAVDEGLSAVWPTPGCTSSAATGRTTRR